MKQIALAGNIGRDAETRTVGSETVTNFSLAVEERRGQERRTIWFDCALWGKRGEALKSYLTKGAKVSVCGELSTREHDGKTYLTVRVAEVTLQGSRGEAGGGGGGYDQSPRGAPADLDDDVPFIRAFEVL